LIKKDLKELFIKMEFKEREHGYSGYLPEKVIPILS